MPDYKDLTSRKAVLATMARYDEMGGQAFLDAYGYGEASLYLAHHAGRTYDSKAIVGVAYGVQYPDHGPLVAGSFSGGKGHAAGHLARLGFEVAGVTLPEEHWTLDEVEPIVARFFAMFAQQDAAGYSQSEHLKLAAGEVPSRKISAISRKISNINAILLEMDLPPLGRFGNSPNAQTLLRAVVHDWITNHEEIFGAVRPGTAGHDASRRTAPPEGQALETVRGKRRAVRVDFDAVDARNRLLGRAGEAWALAQLKQELIDAGRADLAARTVWVSDVLGDGLGYDIASFTVDGSPIQVEVKTTNGGRAASFLVSANEVRTSVEAAESFVLMRIYDFAGEPRYYNLAGSLEKTCRLRPASYLAAPA
ncbi:hypothetical protein J2800_000971 [Caulobacter rhizosphaerae]|uniref:Protein NO VEIN C-terminal domain-containing protein n=1 Tax=Caulobacter rhizosphaerae TaxID=2010972 RepID=A0ABU1MWL3_9CAUL|nr:DUF3883 domain-containing protein [Caulobacter rhizosphaerae]MDR6530235.1 hypothetical protein [Caulobacter rhizosphaerae]